MSGGEKCWARIGYGAMRLVGERRPSGLGWAGASEGDAVRLLRRAVELGVDHIDTAEFYAGGRVNKLLRTALAPYDGLVVATKIRARIDPSSPAGLVTAQKPEELRRSFKTTCVRWASISCRWCTCAAPTPHPASSPKVINAFRSMINWLS